MKNPLLLCLTAIALSILLVACASTHPPSKAEMMLYNVQTNVVPKVVESQQVTFSTNQIATVDASGKTNIVTTLSSVTNSVVQTNFVTLYTLTPKAGIQDSVSGAGGILGSVGGPWGTLGAVLLGGGYSLWARMRSRDREGTYAQIIETARQVIASKAGAAAEQSFMSWAVSHQSDSGFIGQISDVVKKFVDSGKAKGDASTILAKI